MKRLTLQTKLFILFLVIAIIPLIISGYLGYNTTKSTLEQQIVENLILIAEGKEEHLFSFLNHIQGRTIDFSSDGFVRDTTEKIVNHNASAQLIENLNRHLKENKMPLDDTIYGISVFDLDGQIIASTDEREIGMDESEEAYFLLAKDTDYGSAYIDDAHLSHHFNLSIPSVAVSAPLTNKDSGVQIGVIDRKSVV